MTFISFSLCTIVPSHFKVDLEQCTCAHYSTYSLSHGSCISIYQLSTAWLELASGAARHGEELGFLMRHAMRAYAHCSASYCYIDHALAPPPFRILTVFVPITAPPAYLKICSHHGPIEYFCSTEHYRTCVRIILMCFIINEFQPVPNFTLTVCSTIYSFLYRIC